MNVRVGISQEATSTRWIKADVELSETDLAAIAEMDVTKAPFTIRYAALYAQAQKFAAIAIANQDKSETNLRHVAQAKVDAEKTLARLKEFA